jgi:hypothetical protein
VNYFSLVDYYKMVFLLTNSQRLSVSEIENMYPWEYEIYLNMLQTHLEEENQNKQEQYNSDLMR